MVTDPERHRQFGVLTTLDVAGAVAHRGVPLMRIRGFPRFNPP